MNVYTQPGLEIEAIPPKETRPAYVYNVFIRGELKYQFMESIWYDTASPAQGCISRLREIKRELPGVVFVAMESNTR